MESEIVAENSETIVNQQESVLETLATEKPSVIIERIKSFFSPEFFRQFVVVVIAIVLLYLVYAALKRIFKRVPDTKMKPQSKTLILKVLKYIFEALVIIYILNLFGINLTALFGAAGIAGIAIGLAAQTSLGNVISGFFILQERVFKIGDHIKINDVEGTVESIDFLSIKVKTWDNQIVRVPNENVIKTNVQNFSAKPLRRICMFITVPNETDFSVVLPQLENVVKSTEFVLAEPKCSVACADYVDNRTQLRIIAWTKYENFLACKSKLIIELNNECKKSGIKIQYPVFELTGKVGSDKND